MAKSVVQKGEDWVSDKYQKAKDFVKEDVDAWKAILSSSPEATDQSSSQDTSKSPDMGPNGSVWKSGHKKGGIIRGNGCEIRGKTKGRFV